LIVILVLSLETGSPGKDKSTMLFKKNSISHEKIGSQNKKNICPPHCVKGGLNAVDTQVDC